MPTLQRDDNYQPVQGNDAFIATKRITFDGSANKGAIGTFPIFTVAGDVLIRMVGLCRTTCVSVTGTVVIGTAGSPSGIFSSLAVTNLVAGDVHTSGTSPADVAAIGASPFVVNAGADIIGTIAVGAVTAGVIDYYVFWRPISSDGNVVAA